MKDSMGKPRGSDGARVTSLTDIQSQTISQTRESAFQKLRDKVRNQQREIAEKHGDDLSR